jgi:hypothetical protein
MRVSERKVDEPSVFLNVPFDEAYRPLFIALIAGLSALGLKPRCVLEVAAHRSDRLQRILDLIAVCGASIHDLSRVSLSGKLKVPRFNMPFELGLAMAFSRVQGHRVFVLEERPFRLQATLSDLNGYDPYLHNGTQQGMLRCLLDCFAAPGKAPSSTLLTRLTRRLTRVVEKLEREHGVSSPFYPVLFRQTTDAATGLAKEDGLIV